MDWFTSMLSDNPYLALISMLIFSIGGIVHIALIVINKFGWTGGKQPDLNTVLKQVNLIGDNHLHDMPEVLQNTRIANEKLDKIVEILTEIKFNTRK